MRALHLAYPEYRWDHNKGYLTADHINAIQTYGTTEYHRMSFRKVGDAT
jgi:ribonuclease HII